MAAAPPPAAATTTDFAFANASAARRASFANSAAPTASLHVIMLIACADAAPVAFTAVAWAACLAAIP